MGYAYMVEDGLGLWLEELAGIRVTYSQQARNLHVCQQVTKAVPAHANATGHACELCLSGLGIAAEDRFVMHCLLLGHVLSAR